MGYFLIGYVTGVGCSIVAASIIIVLSRAYDRIKDKRNAFNNTSGR